MKFYVEGIRCSKCVAKIENLTIQNSRLSSLEVDLAHQTAVVELKTEKDSFAEVAEAIQALGFKAVPLQFQDDSSEEWKKESRKDLIRIAIAGFCAGNIMMLSFGVYFGLEGELKTTFEWIQLLLYLPVVSFVAVPFYKGFYQSLKEKNVSIDGPMAVASFIGFAFSTFNLVRGEGSVYFDSTSGFLFLILATRYFQKRTRFEYLRFLKPQSLMETFKARVKVWDDWIWVPSNQLQKSQIVLIKKDEWIPADGIITSEKAVLDLSVLDGESQPRQVQLGFPIKAGARLISDSIEMKVEKTGSETVLGQLLSNLKISNIEDTDSSILSNKASQWLLGIVLSIAIILLVIGTFVDFENYFERAFALLVLACPCAMAFGTPLAFSFSMKKAQEKGILIKSARVFENLKDLHTVFLDKTGTLTSRSWEISDSSLSEVPDFYKQVILSLEASSQHPVAFALREIWSSAVLCPILVSDLPLATANGVSGRISGQSWKFVSFNENEQKWFGLFQDEFLVWKFKLRSQVRAGVQSLVQYFKNLGMKVVLLSGDSKQETNRIAGMIGINKRDVFAELIAIEKVEFIKITPNSVMIGDGVNDSLALQTAKVGIAVQGGVDLALKSADVLLLNEDINSIKSLFDISFLARRQIKRNLLIALTYNSIGGLAAIFGLINPFIAALLMPISSICILVFTWWGVRR